MAPSPYQHIYSKQYQSNDSETKKQNDLFTKYCFCVPLETGCFILGYTSLKQPGYIKLHVSVAAIRVLLSIVGVALYTGHTTNSAIFCVAEIVISAFFILLYYRYANQLKREKLLGDAKPLSKVVSNVISKYPQNIDKAILTEKKEKY
ncbi:hypothetical protein HF086_012801 [Spodoptera exigua]|uniref:Uncharacterized protein n=1 Tax=Spodoptera exigua TaxID=7107 RepID=A0A922MLU1_SPOEX|nr:hypothetical protein HF086_012801 [Spodoptera exigua]